MLSTTAITVLKGLKQETILGGKTKSTSAQEARASEPNFSRADVSVREVS
jgi:hypothetical protein